MTRAEDWKKRIYDELATLVYESYHQGRLSSPEMLCLLELLERVVVERRHNCPLPPLLRRWMAAGPNDEKNREISEIIKATLVNIDWGDSSCERSADIIKDLVGELEKKE